MQKLSIFLLIFFIGGVRNIERIQHCHAYGLKSYNLLAFSDGFEFKEFGRYLRQFASQAYNRPTDCDCHLPDDQNCEPPQKHIIYAGSMALSVSCDGEMIDCVNQMFKTDEIARKYFKVSRFLNCA